MRLVELLDCSVELVALLPFDKQLGDLGTSFDVLGLHFANFAFLRGRTFRFRLHRPKSILRELALVLVERLLRLEMPDLSLLLGHVRPRQADDLRKSRVISLDLGRNMLALDERGTKQDKSIRWPGNMVLGFLFGVRLTSRRGLSPQRVGT